MDAALDYRSPRARRIKTPPTPRECRGFRLAYVATCSVVMVVGIVTLWVNRIDPTGGNEGLVVDLLFALWVLGAILITSLLWIFRLWRYRENWGQRAACTIPILVALIILVLTACLVLGGLPFQWAFSFSRPALLRKFSAIRQGSLDHIMSAFSPSRNSKSMAPMWSLSSRDRKILTRNPA